MISLLLYFAFSAAAEIPYYHHNVIHERVLVMDSWRGAYLRSFINVDWNRVAFYYCGEKEDSRCRDLIKREIHKEELPALTATFLRRLAEVRSRHLKNMSVNWAKRYFTGQDDLETLDQLMAAVRAEGLDKWILLRDDGRTPPKFQTAEMLDELAKALVKTFSAEKLPAPHEFQSAELR